MLSRLSNPFRRMVFRSTHHFSSNVEVTPQVKELATGDLTTVYKNGELVTRSALVLRQREQVEEYVLNMIRGYFKTTSKAELNMESNLKDHGIDSLDVIELAMQIEEDLGYQISAENLTIFHKAKHFANFISQTEEFKRVYQKDPIF